MQIEQVLEHMLIVLCISMVFCFFLLAVVSQLHCVNLVFFRCKLLSVSRTKFNVYLFIEIVLLKPEISAIGPGVHSLYNRKHANVSFVYLTNFMWHGDNGRLRAKLIFCVK